MTSKKPDPFLVDEDNPLWTKPDFEKALPAAEVLAEQGIVMPRAPGRPKADNPKVPVTIRLDAEVVEALKAGGKGWQTVVNNMLRRGLGM